MKNSALVTFAVLLITTGPTSAVTRRVPSEYPKIQQAIHDCNHGDVVIVDPGRYYETINFSGKNITLTSTDPNDPQVVADTIIDADGDGSTVTFENGETPEAMLTGFTITGGFGTLDPSGVEGIRLYWGAGICILAASPTITGNVIAGNHGLSRISSENPEDWQICYGGAIGGAAGNAVISRNVMKNNSGYAGGGVIVFGDPMISSNLIYDNSAYVGGGAVMLGGRLINNTIVGNNVSLGAGAGIGGNVYAVFGPQYGESLVLNNIICNAISGGGICWEGTEQDSILFNDVWGNVPGNYGTIDLETYQYIFDGLIDKTGVLGNISEDPLFIDRQANNYHLQTDSPCVNAGDPGYIPRSGETDIDGEARIYALRIDMGADEYVGYVKPVANAGRDQHILEPHHLVTLDGSGSYFYDPCGIRTFRWTQTDGAPVTLSDPNAMRPTFTPESEGEYLFELVVGDRLYASEPDEVLVLVAPNQLPVADAGPDRVCNVPDRIRLDGTGSFDPDPPDQLSYTWRQLQGPEVVLQDADTAEPSFDCDEQGLYVFELVVNDGFVDSEPSSVKVTTISVTVNPQFLDLGGDWVHYPDVSGTKLVYAAGLGDDYSWDVRCMDLDTGKVDSFEGGGIDTQPKIDGDIVVWSGGPLLLGQRGPECTSIFVRNIATSKQRTLRQHTNTQSYSHPAVSGNKVVWLQHIDINKNNPDNWYNTPYDICGADISDLDHPVYFNIKYNAGFRDPYPFQAYDVDFDSVVDISGDIVVWEGEGDIYGADISNLNDIKVFTICNNPARQFDPAISGNIVVWTDERNDQGDIYGADISDLQNISQLIIVKAPGSQQQPAVDGCLVVYTDGSQYGGEIRACCLTRYGLLDIGTAFGWGLGPAIDGETVIWQTDTYGQTMGMSLGFAYSGADGPVENPVRRKYYDYIQHAINDAQPGEQIVASTGTYNESVNFRGKNVTVRSKDPNDPAVIAATVIKGRSDAVTFSATNDANCVLAGFTITGANRGIYCSGASPTITKCAIEQNAGAGVKVYNESNPTITNCSIAANGGAGIDMRGRQVGRLIYYNDATVVNCIIAANQQQGILGSKPSIYSCTIVDNLQQGVLSVMPTIANSIIYHNGIDCDGVQIESNFATVTYSDVQGSWPGPGNIDADPCLVSLSYWADAGDPNVTVRPDEPNAVWVRGDYHLLDTSPCIDAGDPDYVPQLNETDFDGNPRIIGRAIDIGAFESQMSKECFPDTPEYAQQYAEFLAYKAVGADPSCWCESPHDGTHYQCDGDVDGATEIIFQYRVYSKDLRAVVENWKKTIDDPTLNPCADIDHKPENSLKFRVYMNDLNILVANWKKKDSDLRGDCPRPDGQ